MSEQDATLNDLNNSVHLSGDVSCKGRHEIGHQVGNFDRFAMSLERDLLLSSIHDFFGVSVSSRIADHSRSYRIDLRSQ